MPEESVAEISLEEISGPEAFQRNVIEPCQPVILRKGCADWPAHRVATKSDRDLREYLCAFDNGQPAMAFVGDTSIAARYHYGSHRDGFNFERETMAIGPALDRIAQCAENPSLGSVYLGSLPAEVHLPGFAEENVLPFVPPTARPRVWIGNASTVACHYDTFDNVACVVAGRRTFTLFPPEAVSDLYVGPIDHTMAGQPVSLATGSSREDPQYPRFEAIRDRALVVELEPGDALYLPKLWWHQVEAQGDLNLLVNYWWDAFAAGPDAPFTTMMLAMIAIAERPAPERAAWRAFFDHYVFRSNGHPLAHLPAEQHGILGPLDQGNYGRIRAMVMQLLRGS